MPRLRRPPDWKTASGKDMMFVEIEDEHLLNCIRLMGRRLLDKDDRRNYEAGLDRAYLAVMQKESIKKELGLIKHYSHFRKYIPEIYIELASPPRDVKTRDWRPLQKVAQSKMKFRKHIDFIKAVEAAWALGEKNGRLEALQSLILGVNK